MLQEDGVNVFVLAILQRRFEEMREFFELQFEEAGKLGSEIINAVMETYERRGEKKTLGALSDCKIMITIIKCGV